MTSNGSELDVVDIQDMVLIHAKELLNDASKRKADMTQTQIIWDRMYVSHDVTRYKNEHSAQRPTLNVLTSASFTNNTPDPKTFTFLTERRTTSTCDINLTKSFTIGGSVNLKMTPPSATVKANAGFGMQLSQEKGINQTFERELIWTVNKDIVVPPHHVTKAQLVIREAECDGEFIVRSCLEGDVKVVFKSRRGTRILNVMRDISAFLENNSCFETDEHGRLVFVTRGTYKCRFGIEQNVLMEQCPLSQTAGQ